jgi:hypothetical protein
MRTRPRRDTLVTVLEPTPDRPGRAPLLRRIGFVGAAAALSATFAVSLSGIATTQGTIRPDGQAAALAAQQRMQRVHDCPRAHPRPGADSPV